MKRFGDAVSVGSVCFSTHVGPGFAAGTMALVYLIENGWTAVIIGPLFGACIAGIILYAHLESGRVYNVYDYKALSDIWMDWNKPMQKGIAVLRDIIWIGFTLTVTASLLAITQTVCMDVWGIPKVVSSIAMIAAVAVLCMYGANMIRKSGVVIVVAIIVIILYIVAVCWPQASPAGISAFTSRVVYRTPLLVLYYLYMYAGNCCSGIYAALSSSKGALRSRKDVIIACLSFIAPVVILNSLVGIIFLAGMPEISGQNIPYLWALEHFSTTTWGASFYGALVVLAVIGTGVGFSQTIFQRICSTNWGAKLANANYKASVFVTSVVTLTVVTPLSALGVYTLISKGIGICVNFQLPLYFFGVGTAVYSIRKRYKQLRAKGIDPAGDLTEEAFAVETT